MKYDLGCGFKKRDGFIRVDRDPRTCPDIFHDLDVFPWPLEDCSADEVVLDNVLEHLAPLPNDYCKLWQELYRICKPDAVIRIDVPHWLNQNFFHDPTHVRPITPVTIAMMDQERNKGEIEFGRSESPLGLQWRVDFVLKSFGYSFDSLTGEAISCRYEVLAKKPERIGDASISWGGKLGQIT